MIKRFCSYYRPHMKLFIADMLASLAVAVLAILYPMMTRKMLNDLIPNQQYRTVVLYGVGLLLLYIVRMLLIFFIQYYGHVMGVRMQAQMRSDMFRHLERLPYSFFDNHETGKIMSRMTNDLMDISELAHHGPENVLISSVSVIVSFIYLCTINWQLTLVIFGCVPFLLTAAILLRNKMRNAFKTSRVAVAEINAALESSITGIRVTKAFTNQDIEEEKFEAGNTFFVKSKNTAYLAMAEFHASTSFITDVFNVIILVGGGLLLFGAFGGETMQIGDYTTFVTSISLFMSPVMTLINFMEQFQNGATGFERFVEIIDTPIEQDAPDAVPLDRVEGHIELRNVTYGYEEGHPVLDHVSLDIRKGQTFALVGPSGGGKTTICHLIPHFYNCPDGEIYIDGHEIHTVTADSLRRHIGIVQQDVYLFNASIKENILYGKPDATDEEVVEAAKRANIHDYIMSLEHGYATVIGERGVRLSGGQKQRLSIARVFLKNPSILILDEATSALDNSTEILIQQALDELCRGRTTLVVAHRLSTIKNADEIAVISQGKIVEQGSHESLIRQGGVYADLYNLQFRVDNGIR